MATSGDVRRNVKLAVDAEVTGETGLKALADELRDIGQAAGGNTSAALERMAADLERLSLASKEAAAAEDAANKAHAATAVALRQARNEADQHRIAILGTGRATEEQTARTTALSIAVKQAVIAERDARAAKAAAKEASEALAASEKRLADQARATAAAFRAATTESTAGAATFAQSLEGVRAKLTAVQSAIVAAFGGSVLVQGLKSLADTSDAVTNLQARLKLVTGDSAAFAETWRGVQEVAQRTNSSLKATGTLFARIAAAGRAMGVSQREALALTETINQAIQVSGASAQASDAAITQLIQGLQSGVLRGDEFNSVMEQAPRLAQALADGLGVTTGELRKMAEAGALTSATVIGALRGQAEAVRTEYASLPPTVGRAIQQLSNAWATYVNDASTATGASKAAAESISALARNLDVVGATLISLGKAAAGYAALNLAKSFLETAAATAAATTAKTAHTAATVANTTATAANSAALAANAAAATAAGSAAVTGAGRLASILGSLKTFSLVGVLVNLREIGTAVGEWTARLLGADEASKKLERQLEREREATRRNADEKARLAQQTALAADRALGLSTEAKKLVGDFEQIVAKGDGATEALEKVTKALRLGDTKGIQDAISALDALAQRGQLTADQVRQALAAALKTEDLERFRTQAIAAFDGSAQGARRLAAAIDAITTESLRRAGTSVQELKTGFGDAATSAINDLDSLKRSLDDLGIKGEAAGRVLSASIGKALDNAGTVQAVQAVIDRIEALGRAGVLTGDQLAEALTKARSKLDELRPGINSVEEAFKRLGQTAPAELARVAAASKEAWDRIRNDGTVALADKQRAFEAYAKTVTAMAGTEAAALLEIQGKALGLAVSFDGAGKAIVRSLSEAGSATEVLRGQMRDLGAQADQTARSLSSVYEQQRKAWADTVASHKLGGATYDKDGFATDSKGNRITAGTYLAPPDDSGDWTWVPKALSAAYPYGGAWVKSTAGGDGMLGSTTEYRGVEGERRGFIGATTPAVAPAPAPAPAASTSGGYTVNVTLNGQTTKIKTASQSDADNLAALLKSLETAAGRG
jgi:tape measure domain-containing protein